MNSSKDQTEKKNGETGEIFGRGRRKKIKKAG